MLELARQYGADAIAIWIDTPIDVALARNARRAPDKQVPEASVRSVAALFEPPSMGEGFSKVVRWDGSDQAMNLPPQ